MATTAFPGVAAGADDWGPPGGGAPGVHGRLTAEYRLERAKLESGRSDDDQDFLGRASIWTEGVGLPNLETRVAARYSKDLDGSLPEASGLEEWIDLRDVRYAPRQLLFLSTAYARLRDLGPAHVEVTAGRQFAEEVEWASFDGLGVSAGPVTDLRLEAGAFGGRRVMFWKETDRKLVTGGHVSARIGEVGLRVSDVYFVRNSLEATSSYEVHNPWPTLYAASLRLIDERPDRLLITSDFENPELGLDVDWLYEKKFRTGRKTFDYDHVSVDEAITRLRYTELAPFDRVEGRIRKALAAPLGAYAGMERKRLRDRDDQDAFNASFWRWFGGIDLAEWPWTGLRIDARGSYADVHRPAIPPSPPFDSLVGEGERRIVELAVEVRQRFGKLAVAGVEYTWRQYDYRSLREDLGTIDAHALRLFARVTPGGGWSLRVDLFLTDDLEGVYEDPLEHAEGVWAAVEYAF